MKRQIAQNIKKVLALSLILLILICSFTSLAKAAVYKRVYDYAELLSVNEAEGLNILFEDFNAENGIDIAFATTMDKGSKTIEAYSDDLYEEFRDNGDLAKDGLILTVDMGSRELHISTFGTAINKFSDVALDNIIAQVAPYLTSGDFFEAGKTFAAEAEYVLEYMPYTSDSQDQYYDYDDELIGSTSGSFFNFSYLLVAIIVALIICIIMYFSHKKSMNSTPSVLSYQDAKGLVLTVNQDTFLRTHTSKTRIPQQSSGGGGHAGGGGSSTHRTSSGGTAGGRSGKF